MKNPSLPVRLAVSAVVLVLAWVLAQATGLVADLERALGIDLPGQVRITGRDLGTSLPDLSGPGTRPATRAPFATPTAAQAAELVAGARIGQAQASGYRREAFGDGWARTDGCDTRNQILARDLTDIERDGRCRVTSGRLADPYTGRAIDFVRGPETSDRVQIDHIVPLAAAWRGGADQWTEDQRLTFANDPRNLLAVDGPSNNRKSDKTIASVLDSSIVAPAFRCTYAAAYAQIMTTYDLTWTQADARAAAKELDRC